jgi:hypothetical protein
VLLINKDRSALQLRAQVSPEVASAKTVTWTVINHTGQASINSTGLLTATGDGTVTIIANATDDSGVKGTLDINIEGIKPMVLVTIEDELMVTFDEIFSSCKLDLYDFYGHLIKSIFVENNSCVIDISSVRPGVYFVVLTKNTTSMTGKVLIM